MGYRLGPNKNSKTTTSLSTVCVCTIRQELRPATLAEWKAAAPLSCLLLALSCNELTLTQNTAVEAPEEPQRSGTSS